MSQSQSVSIANSRKNNMALWCGTPMKRREVFTDINNIIGRSCIGELKDVCVAGPLNDQILLYNFICKCWKNVNPGDRPDIFPRYLYQLCDMCDPWVEPTNGQYLKYDAATETWCPGDGGAVTVNKLCEIIDVDCLTCPLHMGATLVYTGTAAAHDDWNINPCCYRTIYVSTSGNNDHLGSTDVTPVLKMEVAMQRALQFGSKARTVICVMTPNCLWDCNACDASLTDLSPYVINCNLMNGCSIQPLLIKGCNTTLETTSLSPPQVSPVVLEAAIAGFEINPRQIIGNAWDGTALDTSMEWATVLINGAYRTVPIVIDDQDDNTGTRAYMTYWDENVDSGFVSTPTIYPRTCSESIRYQTSMDIIGPIEFINVNIRIDSGKELKIIDTAELSYLSIYSPVGYRSKFTLQGENVKCTYVRFTNLDISATNSSTSETGSKMTFVNCVFKNCTFKEAENLTFIGCIFYNNPLIFDNIAAKVKISFSLFIYGYTLLPAWKAGLMHINGGSVYMNYCKIFTPAFDAGLLPLTKTLFLGTANSVYHLRKTCVISGSMFADAATFSMHSSDALFMCLEHGSNGIIDECLIVESGPANRSLFVSASGSKLIFDNTTVNAENKVLVTLLNGELQALNLDNIVNLLSFCYSIGGEVHLSNINISWTFNSNKLREVFLYVVASYVSGVYNTSDGSGAIWVDLDPGTTLPILYSEQSNVSMYFNPISGNHDMTGRIVANNSDVTLIGHTDINIVNGVTTNGAVLDSTTSNIRLVNISLKSTHTTQGVGLHAKAGSRVNVIHNEIGDGIITLSKQALIVTDDSHVSIYGKFKHIKTVTFVRPVFECRNHSSISLLTTFTEGDGENLDIDRTSLTVSLYPVIIIEDNSHVTITNGSTDKDKIYGDDGFTMTTSAPHLHLKGTSLVGFPVVVVDNCSSWVLNQVHVTFDALCEPIYIGGGSKFIGRACNFIDTIQNQSKVNYFRVVDSYLNITGEACGWLVAYAPRITAVGTTTEQTAIIIASNSDIIVRKMVIDVHHECGDHQSIVKAENNSRVMFIDNVKDSWNPFAHQFKYGVWLCANSKCTYNFLNYITHNGVKPLLDLAVGASPTSGNDQAVIDATSLAIFPAEAKRPEDVCECCCCTRVCDPYDQPNYTLQEE